MHKKAQASALTSFSISFSAYLMFSMPTTFFSLHIIVGVFHPLNFAFNLNAKEHLCAHMVTMLSISLLQLYGVH
jgi:hypothetical protein